MTTSIAAAGDTWGIPGPTFLRLFLLAATVLMIAAIVHRRFLLAGPPGLEPEQLNPQQVAYLNGRERLAVYTALGALRAAKAVRMAGGRMSAGVSLPAWSTPLDQAVYNAAGQGTRPRELLTHPWVVAALDRLRQQLEGDGLAVTARQRRRARFVPVLMLGLLGLGLARLVAGIAADKPVLLLILLLALYGIVTLVLLLSVPRRTTAAKRAISRLRSRNSHLSPAKSPAYATYGTAGAAMGVALYGATSLWALDPAFAAKAGIERSSATAGGGGSFGGDSGGGGGCGGSGGCGGGGGCGG